MNIQCRTDYPYYVPNVEYPNPGLPARSVGYEEIRDLFGVAYMPDHLNTRLRIYFRIDLNYTLEERLKRGTLVPAILAFQRNKQKQSLRRIQEGRQI